MHFYKKNNFYFFGMSVLTAFYLNKTLFPNFHHELLEMWLDLMKPYLEFLNSIRRMLSKYLMPLESSSNLTWIPLWETKLSLFLNMIFGICMLFIQNILLFNAFMMNSKSFHLNKIIWKHFSLKIFMMWFIKGFVVIFLFTMGFLAMSTFYNSGFFIDLERKFFHEMIPLLYADPEVRNFMQQYGLLIPLTDVHARMMYISELADFALQDDVYVDANSEFSVSLQMGFSNKTFPKEFGITHLDKSFIELLESKWMFFKMIKGGMLY